MYSGLYTAASGMTTQNKALGVIANNISNLNTAGFKKDTILTKTFGEHMEIQNGNEVGTVNFGNKVDGIFTDFEQGVSVETGRALDFCIEGEGFFNVLMPDETVVLTRNGQFSIDSEGYLKSGKGYVLGQTGPLQVDNALFKLDMEGNVYVEDFYSIGVTDKLLITNPADLTLLSKTNEGYFVDFGTENNPLACQVVQGKKEMSNLDMIKEMADMLANSRQLQSCSQIIKTFEQIMQKSANEIGRL